MKFTGLLALALPTMAVAQNSTLTTSPSPTPTHDLSVCEEQAGGYADVCPRCEPECADRTGEDYAQCLYSVFFTINGIQSQCWQHGGYDCRNRAVDEVCGPA